MALVAALIFAFFWQPIAAETTLVDTDVKYVVLLHENLHEWQEIRRREGKAATRETLAASDLVPMTGKNGEKFSCYIPTAESLTMEGETKDTTSDEYQLDKLSSELTRCTVMKQGYWTYEVCPFKHVRQFHADDNSDSSTEFLLGSYVDHHFSSPVPGASLRTYTQTFEAGTDGRRSVAVYQCPEVSRSFGPHELKLSGIKEDPIHFYTVTVLTPLVCGITASPSELIGSTATHWKDHCVRQVQRWWTLEVCPGHHVRQYHKEDDGSITEVLLGKFAPHKSALHQAQPDRNPKVSANQLHYTEEFEEGDNCDKTGLARSASVRFFCQLGDAPRDEVQVRRRVARLMEVQTCVYEIDVVVPALCSHSSFKAEVEHANTVVTISCIPSKYLA